MMMRSTGFKSTTTSHSVDPLIGRKIRLRWHEDNKFYDAVITDFNPVEGSHMVMYDIDTPIETFEWLNLKEFSPEDIIWGEEAGAIASQQRRGGPPKRKSKEMVAPGGGPSKNKSKEMVVPASACITDVEAANFLVEVASQKEHIIIADQIQVPVKNTTKFGSVKNAEEPATELEELNDGSTACQSSQEAGKQLVLSSAGSEELATPAGQTSLSTPQQTVPFSSHSVGTVQPPHYPPDCLPYNQYTIPPFYVHPSLAFTQQVPAGGIYTGGVVPAGTAPGQQVYGAYGSGCTNVNSSLRSVGNNGESDDLAASPFKENNTMYITGQAISTEGMWMAGRPARAILSNIGSFYGLTPQGPPAGAQNPEPAPQMYRPAPNRDAMGPALQMYPSAQHHYAMGSTLQMYPLVQHHHPFAFNQAGPARPVWLLVGMDYNGLPLYLSYQYTIPQQTVPVYNYAVGTIPQQTVPVYSHAVDTIPQQTVPVYSHAVGTTPVSAYGMTVPSDNDVPDWQKELRGRLFRSFIDNNNYASSSHSRASESGIVVADPPPAPDRDKEKFEVVLSAEAAMNAEVAPAEDKENSEQDEQPSLFKSLCKRLAEIIAGLAGTTNAALRKQIVVGKAEMDERDHATIVLLAWRCSANRDGIPPENWVRGFTQIMMEASGMCPLGETYRPPLMIPLGDISRFFVVDFLKAEEPVGLKPLPDYLGRNDNLCPVCKDPGSGKIPSTYLNNKNFMECCRRIASILLALNATGDRVVDARRLITFISNSASRAAEILTHICKLKPEELWTTERHERIVKYIEQFATGFRGTIVFFQLEA